MVLVDSHVLLWLLTDSPRLRLDVRTVLMEQARVYVSATTVVELTIKQMLGRLDLPGEIASVIESRGFRMAPLTGREAEAISQLDTLARHDPFDRMLLAQAVTNGWSFLTADRTLLALGLPWVVDARR